MPTQPHNRCKCKDKHSFFCVEGRWGSTLNLPKGGDPCWLRDYEPTKEGR